MRYSQVHEQWLNFWFNYGHAKHEDKPSNSSCDIEKTANYTVPSKL